MDQRLVLTKTHNEVGLYERPAHLIIRKGDKSDVQSTLRKLRAENMLRKSRRALDKRLNNQNEIE